MVVRLKACEERGGALSTDSPFLWQSTIMNSTRSACVMSVHTLVLAPGSDEVQHGRRGAALGHCSPETVHRKQVITMRVIPFTGAAPSNNKDVQAMSSFVETPPHNS